MKSLNIRILFVAIIISLSGTAAFAGEWCQNYGNNYYNGKKQERAQEIREFNLKSTGNLDVDGKQNGSIHVTGADRSDVLVEACVRAWGPTKADAENNLQQTQIDASSKIEAISPTKDFQISVSYRIQVPRNTDLALKAFNGSLKVEGVNGTMNLKTLNGSLKFTDVAGDIKARTTNGSVKIGLGGSGWTGNGIDAQTVNGSVKIYLPSSFAANVISRTTNGSFKSDFPELQIKKEEKGKGWYGRRNKSVNKAINGGGATIKAITTNGSVKILFADKGN